MYSVPENRPGFMRKKKLLSRMIQNRSTTAPAPALHLRRDLRAGSVHDDDAVPLLPQRERLVRGAGGDAPAELDHDAAHVVYSALILT